MALARISICPPVIGTTCAAAQISAAGPRNPATGAIAATTKASAATAKPLVKAHRAPRRRAVADQQRGQHHLDRGKREQPAQRPYRLRSQTRGVTFGARTHARPSGLTEFGSVHGLQCQSGTRSWPPSPQRRHDTACSTPQDEARSG